MPDPRDDLLVTVDGAGFAHALVDHLTTLNTARKADGSHGRRGRLVEYSLGWPVDARTRSAIGALSDDDWTAALTAALTAAGTPDPKAQVADLTGLLRHAVIDGHADVDRLDGWPADLRVIARRTPREPNEQAELDADARWRYGAFATNTAAGQVQWLDARHRTQAHVEDNIKDTKACGAARLPSKDYDRNAAWLQLTTPGRVPARLAAADRPGRRPGPNPTRCGSGSCQRPPDSSPGARKKILKIPPGWAWAQDLATAWDRIHALHPD